MIEYAKITGKVDNKLIQVRMVSGECLYAPMVTLGVSASLPSDLWITNNKDNFLALVSYEGDSYNSPMIIGFLPLKNADSTKYNVNERLLDIVRQLLDILTNARTLTQLGPQNFMPDSLLELGDLKNQLEIVQKDIR